MSVCPRTSLAPTRTSIDDVEAFLAQRRLALVGVSHDPKDMSRLVLKELDARGYDVVLVSRRGGAIDGRPVLTSLRELAAPVDGALVMVPARDAAAVVADCIAMSIPRVWLHRGAGPGATSPEATRLSREAGLLLVDGECPFMFLGGGVHAVHAHARCLEGRFPHGGARPVALGVRVALVSLQVIVGLNAIFAGVALVADPSGAGLGMTTALLAGSPFGSFLVPGLVLFVVNGLGQLGGAALVLRRRPRAGLAAVGLGVFLVLWIGSQLLWVAEPSWLQVAIAAMGVAEIALGLAWSRRSRPPVHGPRLATLAT